MYLVQCIKSYAKWSTVLANCTHTEATRASKLVKPSGPGGFTVIEAVVLKSLSVYCKGGREGGREGRKEGRGGGGEMGKKQSGRGRRRRKRRSDGYGWVNINSSPGSDQSE